MTSLPVSQCVDHLQSLQSVVSSKDAASIRLHEISRTIATLDGLVRPINHRVDTESDARAEISVEVEQLRVCLNAATKNALLYISKVEDFFQCLQDQTRMKRIKESLLNGEYHPLQCLFVELSVCRDKATEHYQAFHVACGKARSFCLTAAEICAHKMWEAQRRKTNVQYYGGVVSAGLLAVGGVITVAGLAASTVIGIMTAGIGTAVGLAVTTNVSGVTLGSIGTLSVIATAVTSKSCDSTIELFQELNDMFGKIAGPIVELNSIVGFIRLTIDTGPCQLQKRRVI